MSARKIPPKVSVKRRTKRPIPTEKRTDWRQMKREVSELISRLRQQPVSCKDFSPTQSVIFALTAFCYGEIDDVRATSVLRDLFSPAPPLPINERTDWSTLAKEARDRINRLRSKPEKSTERCSVSPIYIVDAFVSGDVGREEALHLLNKWAGRPIRLREDFIEMRREVVALLSRLQKFCNNSGYGDVSSPDKIVLSYRDGMLTFDQAVDAINNLVKPMT